MPPKRTGRSQNLIEEEGRISLATKYKKKYGKYLSAAGAAVAFGVSVSTLNNRLRGVPSWDEHRPSGHKVTALEEKSQWENGFSKCTPGAQALHML